MKKLLVSAAAAVALTAPAFAEINLSVVGSYESGVWDEGVAEIVAHHAASEQLVIVNGDSKMIDILSFSDPTQMSFVRSIDVGGKPNSVVVAGDKVVVAIEGDEVDSNGQIGVFSIEGELLMSFEAGVLPDAVAGSPDGKLVASANEGEPSDDYTIDPVGSVTVANLEDGSSFTVDFSTVTADMLDDSVHMPSPEGTTIAQDLEPEYVAFSADGSKVFVTMQENNAMAVVDVASKSVESIKGLGVQDYNSMKIDASDKDGKINMMNYNVLSLFQPDTIKAVNLGGIDYIVMANEGDARDYDGYSEETRVADLTLDPAAYPNAAELQDKTVLGRLKTTTAKGDVDGDGDIDQIYGYGGRSFSIRTMDGELVFDSGSQFAEWTAENLPGIFNSQGVEASFENRSDDKGTEPEALEIGQVGDQTYAFVGLERQGGIMVYNITNPAQASFVQYANNTDYKAEAEMAGDIAPEGIVFIPAEASPIDMPMIVVANEVSGTVTAYAIN